MVRAGQIYLVYIKMRYASLLIIVHVQFWFKKSKDIHVMKLMVVHRQLLINNKIVNVIIVITAIMLKLCLL